MRTNKFLFRLLIFCTVVLGFIVVAFGIYGNEVFYSLFAADYERYVGNDKSIDDIGASIALNWVIPFLVSSSLYKVHELAPAVISYLGILYVLLTAESWPSKYKLNRISFDAALLLIPFAYIFAAPGFQKDVALVVPLFLAFKAIIENRTGLFFGALFLVLLIRIPFAVYLVITYLCVRFPRLSIPILVIGFWIIEFHVPSSANFYSGGGNGGQRASASWAPIFIFIDRIPEPLSIVEYTITTFIQFFSMLLVSTQFVKISLACLISSFMVILLFLRRSGFHRVFVVFALCLGSIPYAQPRYYITFIIAFSLVFATTYRNKVASHE